MNQTLALSLLMLAAGVGIPIMAALNAGLGARIDSPNAATMLVFLVAALAAAVTLAVTGLPSLADWSRAPPLNMAAGLLVAFYVLGITWAAPRIGLGNAIFFVLLGQLVTAAVIDHFGLFGAVQSSLTPRRLLGLVLMVAGVYLARKLV